MTLKQLKHLTRWIRRTLRRDGSTVVAPIIGGCVATRHPVQARVSHDSVTPEAAAAMIGDAAPNEVPMIGIRHGRDYAEQFAFEFVAYVRRSFTHPVRWTVDDVLAVSKLPFAVECGIPVPPDRSLLSALKRLPGIEVQQDVRGFRPNGGKTSVYTIWPAEVSAEGITAPLSGFQQPVSRYAA